jgi:DNA-binding response OmpR family regulator
VRVATILVVDDERLICELLQAILSRHGHEVFTTMNGQDAVALFRELRPRITLLDLRMPGMDGVAVLKKIRDIDAQADVMILSGRLTDALEHQVSLLGVSGVLRKGRPLEELVTALNRILEQPASAEAQAASGGTGSGGEPESVLVVDDEPMVCQLISVFLTGHGYRVRTAHRGADALALVEQDPPQMIVLDMYMPGMNGVQVLHALQAKHYRGGVVVLTASQDERLLQEALALGSVDVLSKPVELDRLLLTIQVGLVLSVS